MGCTVKHLPGLFVFDFLIFLLDVKLHTWNKHRQALAAHQQKSQPTKGWYFL